MIPSDIPNPNQRTLLELLLQQNAQQLSFLDLNWDEKDFLNHKNLLECLILYGNDQIYQYILDSEKKIDKAIDTRATFWAADLLNTIIRLADDDFIFFSSDQDDDIFTKENNRINLIKNIFKKVDKIKLLNYFNSQIPRQALFFNSPVFNNLDEKIKEIIENYGFNENDTKKHQDKYFSIYLDLLKVLFSGPVTSLYPVYNILLFSYENIFKIDHRTAASDMPAVNLSQEEFTRFFDKINVLNQKDIFFNKESINLIIKIFVNLPNPSRPRQQLYQFLADLFEKQSSHPDNNNGHIFVKLMTYFENENNFKNSSFSDYQSLLDFFHDSRERIISLLNNGDHIFMEQVPNKNYYTKPQLEISKSLENIFKKSIVDGDKELSLAVINFVSEQNDQVKLVFIERTYNKIKHIDDSLFETFFLPPPIKLVNLLNKKDNNAEPIIHSLLADAYNNSLSQDSLKKKISSKQTLAKICSSLDPEILIPISKSFLRYFFRGEATEIILNGDEKITSDLNKNSTEKFILDFSVPYDSGSANKFKI